MQKTAANAMELCQMDGALLNSRKTPPRVWSIAGSIAKDKLAQRWRCSLYFALVRRAGLILALAFGVLTPQALKL